MGAGRCASASSSALGARAAGSRAATRRQSPAGRRPRRMPASRRRASAPGSRPDGCAPAAARTPARPSIATMISPSTTQRSRQRLLDRLDDLREVAGEGPLVAAAQLDLVAVAEDDAAEAVPLRLEERAALVACRARAAPWSALASIGDSGGITGRSIVSSASRVARQNSSPSDSSRWRRTKCAGGCSNARAVRDAQPVAGEQGRRDRQAELVERVRRDQVAHQCRAALAQHPQVAAVRPASSTAAVRSTLVSPATMTGAICSRRRRASSGAEAVVMMIVGAGPPATRSGSRSQGPRHHRHGRDRRQTVVDTYRGPHLVGLDRLVPLDPRGVSADDNHVAQRAQKREHLLVVLARQRPGLVVGALGGAVERADEVRAQPVPRRRVGVEVRQVLVADHAGTGRVEGLHASILPPRPAAQTGDEPALGCRGGDRAVGTRPARHRGADRLSTPSAARVRSRVVRHLPTRSCRGVPASCSRRRTRIR